MTAGVPAFAVTWSGRALPAREARRAGTEAANDYLERRL